MGTITHWRIPHFYAIHRFMHPWKIKGFPDVGKFVYRHVHSLHHKSYNPTAFSGTSMHPVEATLYYSAGVLPALLGFHPQKRVMSVKFGKDKNQERPTMKLKCTRICFNNSKKTNLTVLLTYYVVIYKTAVFP